MPANPMNLTIPTVGETVGPEYATEVNDALETIGDHTHVAGEGDPVPAAGLNIDADLSFGSHNATALRSVRFTDQAAVLADPTDIGCVYAKDGDLYYNNEGGTPVQITSGNALNASAVGGFTGLAGTTGAATYNNGTGSFTFTSNTNEKAAIKGGPLSIADAAASAHSVTLKSPTGLAAAYDIEFPAAVPAGDRFVQMTIAGALKNSLNVDGVSLEISGTTLQAKVTPVVATTSSGAFSGSATSPTDVTNMTITITSNGRPILIWAQNDGTANDSRFYVGSTAGEFAHAVLTLDVTGSATATIGRFQIGAHVGANEYVEFSPSSLYFMYQAPAGTYTIKLQYDASAASVVFGAMYMKLVAVEM